MFMLLLDFLKADKIILAFELTHIGLACCCCIRVSFISQRLITSLTAMAGRWILREITMMTMPSFIVGQVCFQR